MSKWLPIETAPEGEPILVWADDLNRGLPSAEVVILYRLGSDLSFWTNGGANGGVDIDFSVPPRHWMPIEPPTT